MSISRPRAHTDVFTPSDYPSLTYVTQTNSNYEQRLRDSLATPGEIISVSGPSKSGKTVLVERVVGRDQLIPVSGSAIRNPFDLWERVLDWMDLPSSQKLSKSASSTTGAEATLTTNVGLGPFAGTTISGKGSVSQSQAGIASNTFPRRGLEDVVREIADSDFVILVDDFHYMPRDIQSEVSKQIKEAARRRVKICTVSVPHRSDDVVRSNPELRGRVQAIDLAYWTRADLIKIGQIGFPAMNASVPDGVLAELANECSGSPQLMQGVCLQLCILKDLRTAPTEHRVLDLGKAEVQNILQDASTRTDFSSLVARMHRGPKSRGTERKDYKMTDGSTGDVYRACLLALKRDPASLSFDYSNYSARIAAVCGPSGTAPQPQSVYQAFEQISRMALELYPDQRIIEWDDSEYLIDVIDPYFLFYLRWSGKLESLGN